MKKLPFYLIKKETRAACLLFVALLMLPLTVKAKISPAAANKPYLSHPALRPLPQPAQRPRSTSGRAFFVNPVIGNNARNGSEKQPWKTIQHALPHLQPGDTLYLRGGTYFENIYCAVAGLPDKPITIRSYPGEQAILNGGLREFAEKPQSAWVALKNGEYRSAKTYRNIRDVLGLFGDSRIGLQTYWHAMDLRAENELWIRDPDKKIMVEPVYCGPGLWYDKQTGYIHTRLAHTKLTTPGLANYQGETDPRKLPLTIAPFNSVPLFIDQGMHLRFQDLVIEGGGQNVVEAQFGVGLEFDNVTIFAGTYGLRTRSTGPLRFTNGAIHGMIAPWMWRTENVLQGYDRLSYDPFLPPKTPNNARHISRLPTHALLVTEGMYEFEVFAYPSNHEWEISNSEFTDAHDGIYLSGRNIRFHHNWVDRIQDDGIYFSSPSPNYNENIHIYQNLITQSLMAFGGHARGGPDGNIYFYRNIVDLRQGIQDGRPTPKNPTGNVHAYHAFLIHGRDFLGIESLYFYQNTILSPADLRSGFLHRLWTNTHQRTQRRVFNNIFVYLNGYPQTTRFLTRPAHDLETGNNLHWSALQREKAPTRYLEEVQEKSAQEKGSLVAAPGFTRFDDAPGEMANYQLQSNSAARSAGRALPAEWEDPLRSSTPDLGAIPYNTAPPPFGRQGRIQFPITGKGN